MIGKSAIMETKRVMIYDILSKSRDIEPLVTDNSTIRARPRHAVTDTGSLTRYYGPEYPDRHD